MLLKHMLNSNNIVPSFVFTVVVVGFAICLAILLIIKTLVTVTDVNSFNGAHLIRVTDIMET